MRYDAARNDSTYTTQHGVLHNSTPESAFDNALRNEGVRNNALRDKVLRKDEICDDSSSVHRATLCRFIFKALHRHSSLYSLLEEAIEFYAQGRETPSFIARHCHKTLYRLHAVAVGCSARGCETPRQYSAVHTGVKPPRVEPSISITASMECMQWRWGALHAGVSQPHAEHTIATFFHHTLQ